MPWERRHPVCNERAARKFPMTAEKQSDPPDGWHSRGYLPHFDGGEIPQSITLRLGDSLPQKLLDKWREELRADDCDNDAALRKRIEIYLDQGYGECHLRDRRVAEMVQSQGTLRASHSRFAYVQLTFALLAWHSKIFLLKVHKLIPFLSFTKILVYLTNRDEKQF
jgi:hypothetical protein